MLLFQLVSVDAIAPGDFPVDANSAPLHGSVDAQVITAPQFTSVDAFAPEYATVDVQMIAPDYATVDAQLSAPDYLTVEANQYKHSAPLYSSVDATSLRKYAPSTDIVESNVYDNI